MGGDGMSWLKRVWAEQEELPQWLSPVLRHPSFHSLHRQLDGDKVYWKITTTQEIEFEEEKLRDACQKFTDHYRER